MMTGDYQAPGPVFSLCAAFDCRIIFYSTFTIQLFDRLYALERHVRHLVAIEKSLIPI